MTTNLGIELLCLDQDSRMIWLKAVAMRRLPEGVVLSQDQLFLGLEHDFEEIRYHYKQFNLPDYTGLDLDGLYRLLQVGALVNAWNHPSEAKLVMERTNRANELEASIPENVQAVLNMTPISMRGFFDNLRDRPNSKNTVTMTEEEFNTTHAKGGKRVIVDKGHSGDH